MRDGNTFDAQEKLPGHLQDPSLPLSEQVVMVSIETTHSFEDIVESLRTIHQPVILKIPEDGEAFNQPEHFQRLRDHGFPEIVSFIVPPNRRDYLAHYISQAGFSFSTSVEEAIEEYTQHFASRQTVKNELFEDGKQWHQTHAPSNALNKELSSSTEWPLFATTITGPQRHFPVIGVLSITTMIVVLLLILSLTLPLFANSTSTGTKTPLPNAALSQQVGELTFMSSGLFNVDYTQGYNDEVILNISGIRPPHPGMAYYAWLMPDTTNDETMPSLLGKLTVNADKVALSFSQPQHANMLLTYSGVRITEQMAASSLPDVPSANPKTWRWQGWIPNTSTPGDEHHYSLLSHLRHLLAKDPTLQENGIPGGLALWLTRNISKIEEWASAAQGQWHGAQTTDADNSLIQRQMLRILDYLDGQMYVWKDVPPGSSWLASPAGPGKLGLLNRIQNQDPPGFLEHVDIHLNGLANSIGSTQQQRQLAIEVDTVIRTINSDLEQVRKDASLIAHMTPAQMRQKKILPILDDMALLTSQDKSGWFDQQKGENVGGVLWVTSSLQQLATIPIRSVNAKV